MPSTVLLSGAPPKAEPLTVHIVERMAPGGIETLVLDMVQGMPGQHVVFSLSGTRAGLVAGWPRLAALGANLEGFDREPGVHPLLVGRLKSRLDTLRPDTVIVHHDGPMVYGGLAARFAGVRTIVHVEHDAWHYDTPRRRALIGLIFKVVRPRRVAVSDEVAARVATYFAGPPVTVIPPGINLAVYRPGDRTFARIRLGLDGNVPIIGTSGRLVSVKSQVTLVEAVALLRKSMPRPPELVIVGNGPERGVLEASARGLGIEHATHLIGHRDDLPEILPAFDVYALPSLHEGLPRGVLEAQAVGVPVVASNVGALADAVCPISGRLVPPGDAHALAGALAGMLAAEPDPATPRAFVKSRYGLSRTLAAFNAVIGQPERVAC